MKVLLALVLAFAGAVATIARVEASTTVPPTSVGFDISFPQCSSTLPSPKGFAIIGVNNGHPFSVNPCLARELQWSKTSLSASPEFYVNASNPGPSSAQWPTGQQSPQVCLGANSVACSFDYGWNAGKGSFARVVAAELATGASSASAAAAAPWWLDVESGNAWQTIRILHAPTAAEFANDQATLEGELAYLSSRGVTSLGIYSTMTQWKGLMGVTGTTFAAERSWLTPYGSLAIAQGGCAAASFTGGRVAMIQYPSQGLDGDFRCPLLSTPTASSVSVAASASFSDQLGVTGESASVTFVQTGGAPSLVVSPTGLVTTTGALAPGVYSATGTTSAGNDRGTFIFALSVGTITQAAPTSGSATVGTSASFNAQLTTTGASGPVTFVQSTGAPSLVVSPTGLVTTSGNLAKGNYSASGTTTDASGDQGTFSFVLHVGSMTQSPPVFASATPLSSATFSNQLVMTGASGPVTFVQTRGAPSLLVSPTGLVTTSGSLAPGSYVVRGTASDPVGDRGTFFFNLRVLTPKAITQAAPTSGSATVGTSASFNAQLTTTGASGPVTFVQSTGAPSLVVSPTGLVTTSGNLAKGNYSASGTTTDASGDQGTFSIVLTVIPSVATPPGLTLPVASRVIGRAVAGRTVTVAVSGLGFFGRPRVVTRAGTTARVMKDTGTRLTIRIHVRAGSPPGAYAMTIVLANHKSCRVRYVQR